MGEHTIPVVRIPEIQPIEGKDRIGYIELGGFTVVVNKADWQEGQLAAYVEPDLLVDVTRPEFAWLADDKSRKYTSESVRCAKEDISPECKYHRVLVKKLGGVPSMGLLVELPDPSPHKFWALTDDLFTRFGAVHFDPPETVVNRGYPKRKLPWWVTLLNHILPYWAMPYFRRWTKQPIRVPEPKGYHPKYDLHNLRKGWSMFPPDARVAVTEKIHGQTIRIVYDGKKLHVGSSREWKREPSDWHDALANTPEVEAWSRKHPNYTLYGESYGPVQKGFGYDSPQQRRIRIFDILTPGGQWYSPGARETEAELCGLPTVPVLAYDVEFNPKALFDLAEGLSHLAGHIREGVVVETVQPYQHPRFGRAKAKIVSNAYLEREK